MHWALVLYSLTVLTPRGSPWVATMNPTYSEAACRVMEERSRAELAAGGYIGICQYFQIGRTPIWPSAVPAPTP